jgi:flagellar hook-associated protein FlgK
MPAKTKPKSQKNSKRNIKDEIIEQTKMMCLKWEELKSLKRASPSAKKNVQICINSSIVKINSLIRELAKENQDVNKIGRDIQPTEA